MSVKIENTVYDSQGEKPMLAWCKMMSDQAAGFYAQLRTENWNEHGWRNEIIETSSNSSVQCLYDSVGTIWETVEYTQI